MGAFVCLCAGMTEIEGKLIEQRVEEGGSGHARLCVESIGV